MTPRAAHRSQAGPIHIPVYRDRPLNAFGLLAGIHNWQLGDDLFWPPDTAATRRIGKAVYRTRNILNYALDMDPDLLSVANAPYFDRYKSLLEVWDDYQRIFGTNAPMKRCQSGFKQWDINFEGVAHYGLLPDLLQDLSNVGLESHDLSVLFRSAEDFARMWTQSLNASFPAQPSD